MRLLKKLIIGFVTAVLMISACMGTVLAEEETESETQLQEDTESGTYNVLLIGVDRRDDSWYGNSDVMLLVTVNPQKEKIYLTSFMRDLYADIPGIGVHKLNAACANGGAELCVQTIKENYQVQIDNYAMVDFNSMAEIVDAIGGVNLEISDAEMEYINAHIASQYSLAGKDDPVYLDHAGEVWLNGYQAVVYSRNRSTGGTSDFGRTERQRKLLTAIFEKAQSDYEETQSSGTLQTLLSYASHDLTGADTLKLMMKVSDWLTYEIEEVRVPFDDMYYIDNEILTPTDMSATREKLQDILYR
ncbi:LCP family protein [Jingyaoa shaoxingensis]|uniref:LCP family protein n=1 Tax=Jingyaoa shaoxingensis TaxID=2763671 RepID=A0ABR7NFR0_9FIRM|nr:LCP family protein [Jingyaoa shaoxingensis]MBC8574662.1 LCP family protein [Jingyaoa shaoxingensis]